MVTRRKVPLLTALHIEPVTHRRVERGRFEDVAEIAEGIVGEGIVI